MAHRFSLHEVPSEFWFFTVPWSLDAITAAGVIFGCYGSVVGVLVATLLSMFRTTRVLFCKRGLYTFLTLVLATILVSRPVARSR